MVWCECRLGVEVGEFGHTVTLPTECCRICTRAEKKRKETLCRAWVCAVVVSFGEGRIHWFRDIHLAPSQKSSMDPPLSTTYTLTQSDSSVLDTLQALQHEA